jgi:hypothetical protein
MTCGFINLTKALAVDAVVIFSISSSFVKSKRAIAHAQNGQKSGFGWFAFALTF